MNRRLLALLTLLSLVLVAIGIVCGPDVAEQAAGTVLRGVGVGRKPNILLITVETLRRDHCSLYGYDRDTTPFLEELAEESIVFDNAWSHSSWTYPSMACVLSGRMPEETGVWHAASGSGDRIVWWLDELHELGYWTGVQSTNRFVTRLFPARPLPKRVSYTRCRPAGEVLSETEDWLGGRAQEPWFIFWHLYDPHGPYEAPLSTKGTFRGDYTGRLNMQCLNVNQIRARAPLTPEEFAHVTGRYDEEILYVDRTVERLVGLLREMGQWQNTCLILTADHGERFGDEGWGHGGWPTDAVTQVPFLVRLRGGKHAGARTDALMGGIDVLPTLLTEAGVPVPEDLPGVNAVSLLDDPRPERRLVQHHVGIEWQDEAEVTYTVCGRQRGIVCGTTHTVEELAVQPEEAVRRRGSEEVLADLKDLGYL